MSAEGFLPGELIKEILWARDWTRDDLAKASGYPVAFINEVITGKRKITVGIARGLAAALGTTAQFWLNMESACRLSILLSEIKCQGSY